MSGYSVFIHVRTVNYCRTLWWTHLATAWVWYSQHLHTTASPCPSIFAIAEGRILGHPNFFSRKTTKRNARHGIVSFIWSHFSGFYSRGFSFALKMAARTPTSQYAVSTLLVLANVTNLVVNIGGFFLLNNSSTMIVVASVTNNRHCFLFSTRLCFHFLVQQHFIKYSLINSNVLSCW